MKVRVPIWRTSLLILGISLVGALLIFSFTFSLFLQPINKWSWNAWAIIAVWFILTLGLFLASIFTSFYEVEKKYVVVHKGHQKLIYYYSDVVYIDEEKSLKKKTVTFYTKQGHSRYLMFDSRGILYKVMIANCKNRLTKEEFEIKYPQVKL